MLNPFEEPMTSSYLTTLYALSFKLMITSRERLALLCLIRLLITSALCTLLANDSDVAVFL